MAVLKTVRHEMHGLDFRYKVSVSVEGLFSTTLPADVVEKLQAANIELRTNRAGNYGFLKADTLDDLSSRVSDLIKEYFSRELVEETTIIEYAIDTQCSYCKDQDGNIVPNGSSSWVGSNDYLWVNGTLEHHATSPGPFGLYVYAKPFVKKVYAYRSGKSKTEYEPAGNCLENDGTYLSHLNAFPNVRPANRTATKEIEYSEEVAKFFVDLLTSICGINEKIKDLLEPESIKQIAQSGQKLLGR